MSISALALILLFIRSGVAEIICEDLPNGVCAFAIASSGKRCLLESYAPKNGHTEYQCRTSEVQVERLSEWIETDDCVDACGADRRSVGISSDSLLDPHFLPKLCTPECLHSCPNIADLFFNLAAGEGVFLPDLCQVQRSGTHRPLSELLSSGEALGPVAASSSSLIAAPPTSL